MINHVSLSLEFLLAVAALKSPRFPCEGSGTGSPLVSVRRGNILSAVVSSFVVGQRARLDKFLVANVALKRPLSRVYPNMLNKMT